MMTSRSPTTVVEIDIDQCSRTYGSTPCTAALATATPDKCFNTFKTCQDEDNYDAATALTLTFVETIDGLAAGAKTVFPSLLSVSTTSAQLNVAGADQYSSPLGRQERVTIRIANFQYQDTLTDQYQAERISGAAQNSGTGYNPLNQGTFWGKFMARNFWKGRPIRVKTGDAGDAISGMRSRSYIIDNITGPDRQGPTGVITIEALPAVSVANDRKALCPAPTEGVVETEFDETETEFTLAPSGIGGDYPASGKVAIGSEIIAFTRSGDVMTVTERGAGGSTASSHSVGEAVQTCYETTAESPAAVIADLLENYTSLPASYVQESTWETEVSTWYPGLAFTTIISEPTPVSTLLSEIGNLGIYLWEDAENEVLELRANRYVDIDDTVTSLDEDEHILENSLTVERRERELLTRVIINFAPVDYSQPVTGASNCKFATVAIDVESEQANSNDMERTKTINTRWLPDVASAEAGAIALRILGRYRELPEYYTFMVDEKDIANVSMASYFELTSGRIETATGESAAVQCQVVGIEEVVPGHRARVRAQKVVFRMKLGYYMGGGASDYGAASTAEKTDGCYWADATETVGSDAAYMWG